METQDIGRVTFFFMCNLDGFKYGNCTSFIFTHKFTRGKGLGLHF